MKKTSDILHDWQKTGRLFSGYKKGEVRFVMLGGRGSGKSMIAMDAMRMQFVSSWSKWKSEWSWKPLKSSQSGKMIWGNVMVRKNRLVLSEFGRQIIEYASPKEALKQQREEFKGILSRG